MQRQLEVEQLLKLINPGSHQTVSNLRYESQHRLPRATVAELPAACKNLKIRSTAIPRDNSKPSLPRIQTANVAKKISLQPYWSDSGPPKDGAILCTGSGDFSAAVKQHPMHRLNFEKDSVPAWCSREQNSHHQRPRAWPTGLVEQ